MKKFITLVFVAVLGGIISLTSYRLLESDYDLATISNSTKNDSFIIPTSYTTVEGRVIADDLPNFVMAAEKSIDAVVHVKNTTSRSSQNSLEDLIYGRRAPRQQIGTGSGVIISPDGMIITNNHVIAGSQKLSITTNDNRTYEAELIGSDPKTDIALLKIDSDVELPFIRFGDSDSARIGEWVLAVGNPFNLNSTVTAGIISAKSRDLSGESRQAFIQTDAAVNPGNSGGALVNENGDLIGINTAITSQTGSYIGYSFAVPSNIARKVIEDIVEFGSVQNGILGVTGNTLNTTLAEKYEVDLTEGFYVESVEKNSGAYDAGLKNGDIITKLDRIEISKFADMKGYLSTKRPDDVIEVTVVRNDRKKVVPVKLSKSELMSVDFLDLELRNIPSSSKKEYGIDHGVLVTKSDNYWLYKNFGLKPGYVITHVNDDPIDSVEDIVSFKQKLGDEASLKNINKLRVIDRYGKAETLRWK